jgi:acetyl esterase/lipase
MTADLRPMVAALLLSSACGSGPAPEGTIEGAADVTYCRRGDRALTIDYAWPIDVAGPLPVALFVHGGGWSAGDKTLHHADTALIAVRTGSR